MQDENKSAFLVEVRNGWDLDKRLFVFKANESIPIKFGEAH
ncbi:hypothetical protein RESH_05244 [Rhodopirellula europaea SH398]|uniref:Uncharacterized protein n=1 Tax=Rhodopirellula europaea SH398 TaxID=1263868 RepID=M5SDG5_9BACT|nr:hypothetical protein RESH_05244 [Rhodopirellula europaea SH398]